MVTVLHKNFLVECRFLLFSISSIGGGTYIISLIINLKHLLQCMKPCVSYMLVSVRHVLAGHSSNVLTYTVTSF